jgi:hypothetical protein
MDWFQIAATALSSGVVVTVLNLSVDYLRKKKIESKEAKYSALLVSHHLLQYARACLDSVNTSIDETKDPEREAYRHEQDPDVKPIFPIFRPFSDKIDLNTIDIEIADDVLNFENVISDNKLIYWHNIGHENGGVTDGVKTCGLSAFQLAARIRIKYALNMTHHNWLGEELAINTANSAP